MVKFLCFLSYPVGREITCVKKTGKWSDFLSKLKVDIEILFKRNSALQLF